MFDCCAISDIIVKRKRKFLHGYAGSDGIACITSRNFSTRRPARQAREGQMLANPHLTGDGKKGEFLTSLLQRTCPVSRTPRRT